MEDFASDLLAPRRQGQQPEPSPQPSPRSPINVGAVADTLQMIPEYAAGGALGIVKGLSDYAVGAAQNVANLPFMPEGAASGIDRYIQRRDQAYEQAAPNAQESVQIGRVAGNVIPALVAGQTAPAATMLGRMAQSGKIGAASSALLPYEGDPKNFWLGKGIQTGVGGALAFAGPAVIEPLFRAGSAAINALGGKARGFGRTLTGGTSDSAVENKIRVELQREGVDWAQIPDGVRRGLLAEAQRALRAGADLDPAAMRRIAIAGQDGIQLTQGQATRNPLAWSREQNLARTEPGQPIADRLSQQNAALVSSLDRRIPSGISADPYDAGNAVIGSLRESDTAIRGPIDSAYAMARDHLGRASPMDAAAFSRQANLSLDDEMLGAYLPAEARTILNGISAGEIPFNVNTATQIDRVLSAAQRSAGQGSPQALAIGRVRDSLNSAPIADNVGADAKSAFDAARGLARERFNVLNQTPGMADAVEPGARIAPEGFIEKYVIGKSASIDDVRNLLRQLNPSARLHMQAQVMDYLRRQATSGASTETAKFSQSQFRKGLDRIGDRKLRLIFGGDVAAQLRNTQRTAEIVQVDPVAAGVNRSWTAPAALDFMDQISRLPVISAIAGRPSDVYRGYIANQALNMPLGTPGQLGQGMLSQEMINRAAPRAGLLPGSIAPFVATGLLDK